jgi:uncharacterized protein YjdB
LNIKISKEKEKKMKKVFLSILLLTVVILTLAVSVNTYAANSDVEFNVVTMSAKTGDTITLVVNMDCTNNFAAANFVLNYDSSILEYIPYTSGGEVDYTQNCGETILNGGVPTCTLAINSSTAGTIKVGYMSQANVAGKNGEFLKFQFRAKAAGTAQVSMSSTTLKNSSGTNLTPEFSNGMVSVLSSVVLDKTTLTLEVGDEDTIAVSSPDGTIYGTIEWTCSNSSVADITLSSDGRTATVTAVGPGQATITASAAGLTATTTLTVQQPEDYTITINTPAWTFLPISQNRSLTAAFDPAANGQGKTLTWSSSNTSIATVDSRGVVTAKASGTCVISVTDGTKTASYNLTVNKILGDIDEDSKITSYDAYRALVLYAAQSSGNPVNEDEVVVLDVERNGTMSSNDAYLILKHSVGLIASFN